MSGHDEDAKARAVRVEALEAAVRNLQAAKATYTLTGTPCTSCGRKTFDARDGYHEVKKIDGIINSLRKLRGAEEG